MKILVTQRPKKASTSHKLLLEKTMFAIFSFLLIACFAHAQSNTTVKGRVTDQTGEGIPNVSVVIKGTSKGVRTGNDGSYTIEVPGNATLLFTSVDFTSREVAVGGRTAIDVSLARSVSNLDQVIVIGYGTQRKKDVTGSTISVKGETLNEIKAPNIFNQLQGRAAGVDIVSNSSQIGAAGQIRIRGNRSITGNNDPLIVVDGMAYGGSLNDINPDNIASVDVLKDASATAIYGSRGSNGVIIITTKHGSIQRPVTSYNGYAGMVKAIGTYRLFNSQEYAQFKADAADGNSATVGANSYALTPTEKANLAKGVNTDWQNLLLTTGLRTSHDVGVRAGNERTQYAFGMGYYRETGIIYNQDLSRYSFNVNIDHKMSERIKVGFTSFNTMVIGNRLGTNAYTTRLSPLFKPYNDDGSINFKPAADQTVDAQQINPLTSIGHNDLIRAYSRRYQFQHNFYGEVKILKDLKFRTTFGYGWSQTVNDNYTGPNTVFNSNSTTAGASLSTQNAEGWQYTINNSFDYNKTFGGKHRLQAQVLQEVQKNHFQQQQFNGVGVPADFIQDYNWQLVNTINPASVGQGTSYSESALIGYMGRAIYSFNDKYLLTATVRTDGASVLAPGRQWVTYPAVSLGWNIDKESFMENVKVFSSLKLRGGWGISSNAGIGAYSTLGSLGSGFYNFGSGTTVGVNYVNGFTINTSPNPDLTWEKTRGLNIGVDFAILNSRISGSIEYYNTATSDILLSKQLPRSNGTNSILANVGKTASNGMEFTISSLNIKSEKEGGFSWRTDFNAFFNREKIVALQNNLQADYNNGWFVGHPITTIYDVKKLGIWQTSEAAQAAVYGVKPGDIKLQDVDKSNSIGAEDRQIVGDFQPKLVAGMTNHFEYKNFDLNVVMFGRFGQTVVCTYLSADGGGAGYPFFLNSRVNQLKIDYWTPNNPTNAFPQPDAGVDGQRYTSTLTYQDGSFIKIRTIDLGYNLPTRMLAKAGIQSLRAYISAQNPFILWSPLVRDHLGIDPEGNGTGN
ncbi:MAG: TonB-dependent receptor, partial [Bacteroidetes bacterium]|nr:TonB-dependent receptor [Bacteroidota bacterium]